MVLRHPGEESDDVKLIVLAALLCAPAALDAEPSVPSAEPLAAEQIYVHAMAAMKEAPVPPFIAFRETVDGRNFRLSCSSDGINVGLHHGVAHGTYDVWVRTSDGSAVSREVAPQASPCPGALLLPAGSTISAMGVPQPTASPAAQSESQEVGGLPLIAAVHVNGARYYHIELLGHEMLAGNDVYHLRLRAYRDPNTHPLTDLFVDPQTFLIREARGEASTHFVVGSGRVAGTIDFERTGSYWLVDHEHFDVAANALLVHVRLDADLAASGIQTPPDLPGIVFPTHAPLPVPVASKQRS